MRKVVSIRKKKENVPQLRGVSSSKFRAEAGGRGIDRYPQSITGKNDRETSPDSTSPRKSRHIKEGGRKGGGGGYDLIQEHEK